MTVKAAQFYSMPPEDVEEMSLFWVNCAFKAQEAEEFARAEIQRLWPKGRPGDVPTWRKPVREEE